MVENQDAPAGSQVSVADFRHPQRLRQRVDIAPALGDSFFER